MNNYQVTISKSVQVEGIGLFTGKSIKIKLCPTLENTGIVFQRVDLDDKPSYKACLENVFDTSRHTTLGPLDKGVQTVEHLLSAVKAYQIDNLLIEIDGPEIPIGDGSAKVFIDLLEEAGLKKQKEKKQNYFLQEAIFFSNKDVHLVALPSDELRISFTLDHPNSFLNSQYFSYLVNLDTYKEQIAPSRTFSFYEQIKPLLDNNIIKGGGLDNAVVIKDNKVLNKEGVRFSNEMVRHKVLDLLGDLSLLGKNFTAHIIAIKSGHNSNILFAKQLIKKLKPKSV